MADLPLQALLSFVLLSFLIELTPGPNMTYLALVALQQGRRAGLAAVGGVALGLAVVGIAAVLGLAAIVEGSPAIRAILRWGGVLYLLYLAWDAWQSRRDIGAAAPGGRYFAQGLVTNLLNPKAFAFYLTIMPRFATETAQPVAQSLLLVATYVLVASSVHATIVLLGGWLKPLLVNARTRRIAAAVFAVALVGVAIWLAWATR